MCVVNHRIQVRSALANEEWALSPIRREMQQDASRDSLGSFTHRSWIVCPPWLFRMRTCPHFVEPRIRQVCSEHAHR
jgi:hypothetical protein